MADLEGQQFGNYKLISYLGDGAFADVYLGEHVYLKKTVAVKVLRVLLPNSDRESFFIEARTVASLVHPHIVQVLDCGVAERIPYLVMNYASHGSLRQRHPDHTVLSPTIVLSYVKQIASALQYAHDRKLIHRDVKPHNILLSPEDELWLSDFGLVMIAHSTMSRVTENTGGTPGYMAPEQFIGRTCPASDQYALAVMAYEWLCGERPFKGSPSELFNQHTFASVPPLREKMPTISPAIEEVVLTALAKEPHLRFASVQAFAEALEHAFPHPAARIDQSPSSAQKALPPVVKQPTANFDAFNTSTPTVLSPMESFPSAQDAIALASDKSSATADDIQAPQVSNTPDLPVAMFREPNTPLPPTAMFREPNTPMPSVPPATMFREPNTPMPPVSPVPSTFPIPPAAMFRGSATPAPAVPSVLPVPPQLQVSSKRGISRRSVLMGLGGAIALVSGASLIWKFASSTVTHNSTVIHPYSTELPSHPATSTPPPTPVPAGTPILIYKGQQSGVRAAAWSPDGQFIASGGIDHTVHIWKAVSGEEILKTPYSGHKGVLNSVAWSPNGKLIASSGEDQTVHVWNAATEQDLLTYTKHQATVRSVAWSPDGKNLASGSEDQTVRVWDAASGIDLPFSPYQHNGKFTSVAWSPNGTLIASGCLDGYVYVMNPTNRNADYALPSSPPLPKGERSVAWSPDGNYIVSGDDNHNVYLWDATTEQMASSFPSGHTNQIQSIAWSPDGQYIASGSLDNTVKIWRFATRKLILTYSHHTNQVWSVAWSPDGQHIASASVDGTVQIWKPL